MRGLARLISSAISSWAKTGPGMKRKARLPARRLVQHLRAQDVGRHQVGGELDALVDQAQDGAERLDQAGLGQARHADQEHVAAGQDGDQRLVDDPLLAEDDPADLAPDLVQPLDRPLDLERDVARFLHDRSFTARRHRRPGFQHRAF